jgi:hypothetical protein
VKRSSPYLAADLDRLSDSRTFFFSSMTYLVHFFDGDSSTIARDCQLSQLENLLNDNSVLIVLRRHRGGQLDENDLAAALDAAKRASGIVGIL